MSKLLTKQLALIAVCGSLAVVPAFANKGKKDYTGTMKSIPYATIKFQPGSAMLSDADKATLTNLVTDARATAKIDEITVAAWSDRAFPRGGTKLSDADRDLAEKRADAIEEHLDKQLQVTDVDTYNMAEDSNWLAKTLNTDDAELKSIFTKRGSRTPVTNAEFHLIRNEGGPSEAVVVVERDLK